MFCSSENIKTLHAQAGKLSYSILFFLLLVMLVSCSKDSTLELKDGYYSAEASDFDEDGWKEFISIVVHKNKIVDVEYDSKNESGLIRTWDIDYMRDVFNERGYYPTQFIRTYTSDLIYRQDPDKIAVFKTAKYEKNCFIALAKAAISQSQIGDPNVIKIDMPSR